MMNKWRKTVNELPKDGKFVRIKYGPDVKNSTLSYKEKTIRFVAEKGFPKLGTGNTVEEWKYM